MRRSEADVKTRITEIRTLYDPLRGERARIRAIMDGGVGGLRALLGQRLKLNTTDIPAMNMFETGSNRLAHVLGRPPSIKTDPYPPSRGLDREHQQARAEKRARIVASYDHRRLSTQLGYQARWLPGYGYAVFVITERRDTKGNRYPVTEIRDPYTSLPGFWSPGEPPEEMLTTRRVPIETLKRIYPERAGDLDGLTSGSVHAAMSWGTADDASRHGVEVVEYHDFEGTYLYVDGISTFLDKIENPLTTGPRFEVVRRATFNLLVGQYNNAIGLLAHMAKLNVLSLIATEDSVNRETNIYGGITNQDYQRGRKAVNYFPQGAKVERPQGDFPVGAMEQINRLENQLRIQTAYPRDQDGLPPTSYTTGRGTDTLRAPAGDMVEEYQRSLSIALENIDARRLEWDEIMYPEGSKPMNGVLGGTGYVEDYNPSKDIAGQWLVRREYGPMAGIDEPSKIVAGIQLLQAGILSREDFRAMMHNLGDLDLVRDNVRRERAEETLWTLLEQAGMSQDPAEQQQAKLIATKIFANPDKAGEELEKFFTAEEPQPSPEEQAMLAAAQPGPEFAGQQPPDVTTVLSQLGQQGGIKGGIQTVGRVA